jgi:hypothetical protein
LKSQFVISRTEDRHGNGCRMRTSSLRSQTATLKTGGTSDEDASGLRSQIVTSNGDDQNDAIRELMAPPKTERKRIGFQVREQRPRYGRYATAGDRGRVT